MRGGEYYLDGDLFFDLKEVVFAGETRESHLVLSFKNGTSLEIPDFGGVRRREIIRALLFSTSGSYRGPKEALEDLVKEEQEDGNKGT